jgi:hypothetical protein
MSNDIDIVDRLRISWTSMTDKQNDERAEAANEIERLRWEVCELSGNGSIDSATREAVERGWNCFQQEDTK